MSGLFSKVPENEEELLSQLENLQKRESISWYEAVRAVQDIAHTACKEAGFPWPLAAQIGLWVEVTIDAAQPGGNIGKVLLNIANTGFLVVPAPASDSKEIVSHSLTELTKYYHHVDKIISSRRMVRRAFELTVIDKPPVAEGPYLHVWERLKEEFADERLVQRLSALDVPDFLRIELLKSLQFAGALLPRLRMKIV